MSNESKNKPEETPEEAAAADQKGVLMVLAIIVTGVSVGILMAWHFGSRPLFGLSRVMDRSISGEDSERGLISGRTESRGPKRVWEGPSFDDGI